MAHSGVIIHYDLSELPDLTPQQELTFYRALQEGLTNGLKHGNSTVFELKMGRDGNQVTFDLKDNGNIQDWFWTFSNGSTGSHDWWNSYCRTEERWQRRTFAHLLSTGTGERRKSRKGVFTLTIPIKILIADDHPIVRDGFQKLLELTDGFEVIGTAENGKQTFRLVLLHHPDVILLDVYMPEMNGLETIQDIRALHSEARILLITSHPSR